MRGVIFLALAALGQAQCNGTIVALSNPNGGVVVAPSAFSTRDCQWSVQTADSDHYLEINITDFFVDSTPPFCQDLPGFPLVDSYTNQQFACAQVNPFCQQAVVANLCPESCFLCDSCYYNYISIIGVDGVEYFRDCQTISLPLVISTQVGNVLIKSSRKFLSNQQPEFGASQDRFSFTYRPIPKANYTRQSYLCSGTKILTSDNGTFTDGSAPNAPYQANANCSWVMSAPPGKFVELTFEKFELQNPSQYDLYSSQKQCTSDVISIIDGSPTSNFSSLMGQYCGTTLPPVTVSSGQNLTIMFEADASVERLGFTVRYRFVDTGSTPPIRCTRNSTFNQTGEANVVSGLDDLACSWTIIPPADKFVRIEFLTHSLTPYQPDCPKDEINIYQASTLLLKSCDQYLPPIITTPLNGTSVTVSFSTTVRTLEYFHFVWTFVDVPIPAPTLCSGTKMITAGVNESGTISDGTVYGIPYNANMLCKWNITAPAGYMLHLDYDYFSLEPAIGCIYDNITVFSGDGVLMQTACGLTVPIHVQSISNSLLVVFYSDLQLNLDGFSATWSVVPASAFVAPCSGVVDVDATANPTGNISSLSAYSAVRNCSWVITAPAGKYIKLEVLSLNLFPRELGYEVCYSESLAVWDGNSTESYMLFKNCGTEEVPVQVSTGNTVLMTYSAMMQVQQGGFTLQYTVVDAPGNTTDRFCGGLETIPTNPDDENGTIINYVRGSLYRPNARCEYVISAPAGKYIKITWDYFGLQDPDNFGFCRDYIIVRDGNSSGRELQRSCGFYTPLPATSTVSTIHVLFVSDNLIQSYGFLAHWEVVDRPGGVSDCSGNRTIFQTPTYGEITDGSNGFGYVNNAYCSWLITAPTGLAVQITYTRVALEAPASNNVCRDYVQVTDGKSKHAKLCGNVTQAMLTSSSFISSTGTVLIEFSSDANNAAPGFSLTYAFVPRPNNEPEYSSNVELVVAVVLLSFFGIVLLCCVFVWYKRRAAAKAIEHIDLNRGQDLRKRTISAEGRAPPVPANTDDIETTGPQPI